MFIITYITKQYQSSKIQFQFLENLEKIWCFFFIK